MRPAARGYYTEFPELPVTRIFQARPGTLPAPRPLQSQSTNNAVSGDAPQAEEMRRTGTRARMESGGANHHPVPSLRRSADILERLPAMINRGRPWRPATLPLATGHRRRSLGRSGNVT
jgi:hypothetical protein